MVDGRSQSHAGLPEGFKTTELGPLPKEWQVADLSRVFAAVDKKAREVRIEPSGEYRLLTVRLYAKGIALRERATGRPIGAKCLYRTEVGDFVFSKIDARNGAWGFVPESLAGGMVSGDFPILRLHSSVDSGFISLALSRPCMWLPIRSLARGTTNRRRVKVPELLRMVVALPPLPEQEKIAAVLSRVQQAKEKAEAVGAALEEFKKSVMKHLFTYGPVPVDEAESVPLKDTPFGQVPAGWKVTPLGECSHVQTGTAKGRRFGDCTTITVPYLRVANVQDGSIDLSELKQIRIRESELTRYALQTGDVVVTEGGDIDKLGRGFIWRGQIPTCVHQNHIFAIRVVRQRDLFIDHPVYKT